MQGAAYFPTNLPYLWIEMTNWVFLEPVRLGVFTFSISAQSDNFEILAFISTWQMLFSAKR